jgi:IS30 family transposase
MISTRSGALVIDTVVVCLTLAKWETVSGRFGGYLTTWFCDAYASWQKGGVENVNGRLRRWLPRQTDIDKVSDEEIQDIS